MVEDVDLRVVVTQLTERLAAQADRQAEAARVQSDRIAQLAHDVASCTARISDLAGQLNKQYVPREIYEQNLRRDDAVHLDLAGDHANVAARFAEFQLEYRRDREKERAERDADRQRLERERAEDARARKNLGVAIAGVALSFLVGLAATVIGVLAL